MAKLQKANRDLWLWLFNEGGRHTASEVAAAMNWHADHAIEQLFSMQRRNLIQKFPPETGSRRNRYGITRLCEVPCGLTIAEVQA